MKKTKKRWTRWSSPALFLLVLGFVSALGEREGHSTTSSLLLSSFNLQKTKVYFAVTGVLGSLGAKAWMPWCSVCNPRLAWTWSEPPTSASWVMGSQAWTTLPAPLFFIVCNVFWSDSPCSPFWPLSLSHCSLLSSKTAPLKKLRFPTWKKSVCYSSFWAWNRVASSYLKNDVIHSSRLNETIVYAARIVYCLYPLIHCWF